jgi:hypothetical protein
MWRAVAALVALVGCEQSTAYVECANGINGVHCKVERRTGSGSVRVCFEHRLLCSNGEETRAHACTTVGEGGFTGVFIPEEKIENLAACDTAVQTSIANVSLEEL